MGQQRDIDTDPGVSRIHIPALPEQITAFGDLLRYVRQRAHLTQSELAVAVGYSREQITKLENGQRLPDVKVLRSLFIAALNLEQEPALADRLLTLAAATHETGRSDNRQNIPRTTPAAHVYQTNLPTPLTSFIGREREISEIKRLLNISRLLALTGAGGVGKTRLAIQAGWELLETFADGVWLVELASLGDPSLVVELTLSALGQSTRPTHEPTLALTDFLRGKHLLLILDNCEHLLIACARLAERLLQSAPQLHILATSRESLGILSATTWRVPSLTVPDSVTRFAAVEILEQSEAVRLFLDRAGAADPGFNLTPENAPFIAQICRRLDGVPLAIELAATRIHVLSIEQIAARLDNRFQLIEGGNTSALPRHQTLRAMVDWSYELLSEPERGLLLQLAVFAGGWTLEAAEAIDASGDTLNLLTALVNKSLVVSDNRPSDHRYRLLETIREYARDKLTQVGSLEPALERHLVYYIGWVEANEVHLRAAQQRIWYQRFEAEQDNLRAALDYAVRIGNGNSGLRLVAGLWFFWFWRGYWREGTAYAKRLFSMTTAVRTQTKARALIGASNLAGRLGEYKLFSQWLDAGRALADELDDKEYMAWACIALSIQQSDYAQVQTLLEDGIALAQQVGNTWLEANIHFMLGDRARATHQVALAERLYTESVALFRQVGDRGVIANPIGNLGRLALEQGNYQRAKAAFEESIMLLREMGNRPGLADWLLQLATVGLLQADYELTHAALREGLPICRDINNQEAFADFLVVAAGLADVAGEPEQAATLLGAADQILEQFSLLHRVVDPFSYAQYTSRLSAVRGQLSESAFSEAWSRGHTLTVESILQTISQN